MKDNNIIAFPCGKDSPVLQKGMSLRDSFANSAMQSVITRLGGRPLCSSDEQGIFNLVAKEAYKYADAMLKQREI